MTQFIQSTPGTLAAAMQQGGQSNPYTQGQLALANGGLASIRRGYMGGGAIGGGIIQGHPMGHRTGYGNPFKKIFKKGKKLVQKLVPKELAPAMTWAAPFMGPIAGPLMGGLGSLKMHGKLDPKIMFASMAPHLSFGRGAGGNLGMGYGKWGAQGKDMNSIRRLLTGQGKGSAGGILNKFNNFGTNLDAKLFGSKGKWLEGQGPGGMERDWISGKKGIFNLGGGTVGEGDMLKVLTKQMTKPDDLIGSMEKIALVLTSSATYAEALDLANKAGIGEGMPGSEAEYNAWKDRINKGTENFWEGTEAENYKTGGRVGYAMGSAQFPPQRRTGLQWGSDKGEGLGGEEVEADMRYEGGFMPYGEEPKADDVPARLSKDEFVFTDQSVAGAGEGDVELGAERLYNVMKNLEAGGRLSEESQGEMGQGIGAII